MPMKLKIGKKYVLADDTIVEMIGMSYEKPTFMVGKDINSNTCYLFYDYGEHQFNPMLFVVSEWEVHNEI